METPNTVVEATQTTETSTEDSTVDASVEYGKQVQTLRGQVDYWQGEAKKAFKDRDKARDLVKNKTAEPNQDKGYQELAAELSAFKRRQTFRDAVDDVGITLNRKQMEVLEGAYHASNPEDVAVWIKERADIFAMPPAQQPIVAGRPVQVIPPQSAPVSNQGPGVKTASDALPDDPRLIPPHIWQGMSRDDRMERANAWMAKSGMYPVSGSNKRKTG